MSKIALLINMLTFSTGANTDSHSLWLFATYIEGETSFPQFTTVVMLDDLPVGRYDSITMRYDRYKKINNENQDSEQKDAAMAFGYIHKGMKYRASLLGKHFNYTDRLLVQQRLAGCDMQNDDFGHTRSKDAFDGQDTEETYFGKSVNDEIFSPNRIWPLMWDLNQKVYCKWLYTYIYHPICIKTLKRYLKEEKNQVRRKERPIVRVFTKQATPSGGVQVTCLATGFYPRHLNMTLLKNGQAIPENLVTSGETLPNGDGTYQMRTSTEVSLRELGQKHNYTCTATHLSLDNKLDIHIDYDPGTPLPSIISIVVLMLVICVMLPTAAFFIWKKRCVASKTSSQSEYSAASLTEDSEKYIGLERLRHSLR